MKKLSVCMGVLVALLWAVSSTQAITQGPGGRLYMTHYDTTSGGIVLRSLVLDENWDAVNGGTTDWESNGVVGDNNDGTNHRNAGISPELMTYGGDGYGTQLFGIYYNNTPVSLIAGEETMDAVEVTPSSGSCTSTLIGDGKANPTGSSWYNSTTASKACTDRGWVALPDPEGGFLSEGQIITSAQGRRSHIHVNCDCADDADTDPTNSGDRCGDGVAPNDYVNYSDYTFGNVTDYEFLGDRLYVMSSYWGDPASGPGAGLGYYTRETDGTLTAHETGFLYHDPNVMSGGATNTNGILLESIQGVAVTEVTIADGDYAGTHHAAYAACNLRSWNDPTGGSITALGLFVDLNDDGDAMDNDIGEITWIYRSDDPVINSDWDPGATWVDMEIVENADGKKFLMILRDHGTNSEPGGACDYVLVLELEDNGDWVGTADAMKVVCYAGTPGGSWWSETLTGWPTLGREIEFDSNLNKSGDAIPEPATMLLLGTGALSAIGYVRRRRM